MGKHSVVALIVGTVIGTTGSMIAMGLFGSNSPKSSGNTPVDVVCESSEKPGVEKITTQRNDANKKESQSLIKKTIQDEDPKASVDLNQVNVHIDGMKSGKTSETSEETNKR